MTKIGKYLLILAALIPLASHGASTFQLTDLEKRVYAAFGEMQRSDFMRGDYTELLADADVVIATAAKVSDTYGRNEVAGDQAFYNQRTLLSGTIAAINSGIENTPYIIFQTRDVFGVQAHMTGDTVDLDAAAQLRRGQKLTLLCVGTGSIAGIPLFHRCHFLETAALLYWQRLNSLVQAFYRGAKVDNPYARRFGILVPTIAAMVPEAACETSGAACQKAIREALLPRNKKRLDDASDIAAYRMMDAGIALRRVD